MKLSKIERLEYYGITSDNQILGMIERVCDIFGNGVNNAAKIFIEKISRHESHLCDIKDHSENYGEGPTQLDRETFTWILEKLDTSRYVDEVLLFEQYYFSDIKKLRYKDLRSRPDVSLAITRLRLKFIPEPFPIDDEGMWNMYETYWNGKGENGGAATREKWDRDTKDCFFKVGD